MSEQFALEIKNLKVVYNEKTSSEVIALNNVNLQVKKGDTLVITGGNGSGKSTLLNAIAGTVPVKEGQIKINGIDITNWSISKRAKVLGFVYQDTMLGTCPNLSLQENFQLTNPKKWWLPIPYSRKLKREQIENIKKTGLPLEYRGATKINMLSGGQRQAISVCLAFENEKPILLFDEFTSALDETTKQNILNYTFELAKRNNTTLLMVTHNAEDIKKYTTNFFFMI